MDISVVIPLYNEEESLKTLVSQISEMMNQNRYSFELIFIDDGSNDNSWAAIQKLAGENKFIKAISFRRNYGKSAALNEGFKITSGEVIITMDADLQDNPEEIPGIYNMIRDKNFDLVSGWKKVRHDPLSKTIPTKIFNWATRKFSGIHLHDFNCGLKGYRKEVVKSIEVYGEMHRYIPLIAKWAGFRKIGEKVVEHKPRRYGKTKFGSERFINGFLDLLTILFVSKFGKRPMHFFGTFGILSFIAGAMVALWLISVKVYNSLHHIRGRDVVDQPLFFLALIAVVIGAQLFLAGFLAELISRTASERNFYNKKDTIRID